MPDLLLDVRMSSGIGAAEDYGLHLIHHTLVTDSEILAAYKLTSSRVESFN